MRLALIGFVLATIGLPLAAQTLSVTVSNIPATATRIGVLVDRGVAPAVLNASQPVASGTMSATVVLSVPSGTGYRVRAFADGLNGFQASGQGGTITVGPGSSSVNIGLTTVTAYFDPAIPASAGPGIPIRIAFTVSDPGDILEGHSAELYTSGSPFSGPSAHVTGAASLTRVSPGVYTAGFDVNTPVLGSALYYACRLSATQGATSTTLDLPAGLAARSIPLTGATNLSLNVSNIPGSAIRIGILIDGAAAAGVLWGSVTVAGAANLTVPIAVPAGSAYRVRAFASGTNGLLRSGKAASVTAPATGSAAVSIPLFDVASAASASNPITTSTGSQIALRFDIADPGGVLENSAASLFCSPTAFTGMAATNCASAWTSRTTDGSYALTFGAVVQTAAPYWYYAWRAYFGVGDAVSWLDSGSSAGSIGLSGIPFSVAVGNIPPAATEVAVIIDGPTVFAPVQTRVTVPAASTSAYLTTLLPSGGGYRVRAIASDSGGLLRSGRVSGITVGSGTGETLVTLDDVSIVADAANPASLAPGASAQLLFRITDPGDAIENQPAALYYGPAPFTLPGGTHLTDVIPVKIGESTYSVLFSGTLPTASATFHYAVHIWLGNTALSLPRPGIPAFQIASGVPCSYSVNPVSLALTGTGASGGFAITAPALACPWNAHTSANWIALSPAGSFASGVGVLNYTVAPNPGAPRSAVIRIGTLSVGVSQSASPSLCSYSVSSTPAASIPSVGGTFTARVDTTPGCAWTASSASPWVNISGAASGAGFATFSYSVAANTGDPRSGTLLVGGKTLAVTQRASFYNDAAFIRQIYDDLFNRAPDSGGMNYWLNLLTRGQVSRDQLASFFFQSQEFAENGLFVIKLYTAVFGRMPDIPGLQYWVDVLRSGARPIDLVTLFIVSPEYAYRFGNPDNASFVTIMYRNVLAREPDASGWNYWTSTLNRGAVTRAELMYFFVQSPELDNRMRVEAYALLLYTGFLRRQPDASGFDYWVGVMRTSPLTDVVHWFIYSPEYILRF